MSTHDRDEFQERLEKLDNEFRSVRRVFVSLLFLIAVAVISSLAYRFSGVVFHPKPRTGVYSGFRTASAQSVSFPRS